MPEEPLKLIKIPLGREIVIKKANFPPLDNLDLNLLENPKLLKKDAPLIPITPIKKPTDICYRATLYYCKKCKHTNLIVKYIDYSRNIDYSF